MKIDHVNIVVSDMDRSVEFYARLGLRVSMDTFISGAWIANLSGVKDEVHQARVVFMEPGDGTARLEMIQYIVPADHAGQIPANSRSNTIGVRHFALTVDDIMQAYEALSRAEVTFLSEPQEVTGNKDVAMRIGRKTMAYLLDPDGIIVELAQYSPPGA